MSEQYDPSKVKMLVGGTVITGHAEAEKVYVDREGDFKFKPDGQTCSRCQNPMIPGGYTTKKELREYGSPGFGLQFPEGRHSLRYWACPQCDTK